MTFSPCLIRSSTRGGETRFALGDPLVDRYLDRVVADEYQAVTTQIDAPYQTAGTPNALPAEIETAAMTRLRREAHARMLDNGLCTRPVELECRMESACETCAYFQTGPEFVPILIRQRDHALDHNHPTEQRSSTTSSNESQARVLDNHHPYNAGTAHGRSRRSGATFGASGTTA